MTEKSWLKLTIKSDPQLLDPISDFLVGCFESGVESAAMDEPGYGTLQCYIEDSDPDPAQVEEILLKVSAYLRELSEIFLVQMPALSHEMIGDQDWGKNWKRFFKPFHIVDDLVIVPTWEKYSPNNGESVITMDPGMAFGTGHHSTTSLCLESIRDTLRGKKDRTVLDVGTGTGILAMAAIRYGALRAMGIDNDPEAVDAAKENVKLNGMQDTIEITDTKIGTLPEQYDVVVANIVHDVLIDLAGGLAQVITEGGTLILSGIFAGEQCNNIQKVFTGKGLRFVRKMERKKWSVVLFIK